MQIVQELCKRPGLNRTGFDMPTIYIPSMNQKVSTVVHNSLTEQSEKQEISSQRKFVVNLPIISLRGYN